MLEHYFLDFLGIIWSEERGGKLVKIHVNCVTGLLAIFVLR